MSHDHKVLVSGFFTSLVMFFLGHGFFIRRGQRRRGEGQGKMEAKRDEKTQRGIATGYGAEIGTVFVDIYNNTLNRNRTRTVNNYIND